MKICDFCQCFGKETEEISKIIKCDTYTNTNIQT